MSIIGQIWSTCLIEPSFLASEFLYCSKHEFFLNALFFKSEKVSCCLSETQLSSYEKTTRICNSRLRKNSNYWQRTKLRSHSARPGYIHAHTRMQCSTGALLAASTAHTCGHLVPNVSDTLQGVDALLVCIPRAHIPLSCRPVTLHLKSVKC